MQTLFLSDLHLGEKSSITNQFFETFVEYCCENYQHIDAMYILGDLFEFWIGDDVSNDFTLQVFTQLKKLSQLGISCYLMHGNRDFLLGDKFSHETGFALIADPYVLTLDGNKVLLSHGDNLCTDDDAYQAFSLQVRNPVWQQQFLALPIEQRWKMAMAAREQSGQHQKDLQQQDQSKYQEIIADVNQQAVCDLMSQYQANILIHGHTHQPDSHSFELNGQQVQRLVLSAWYQQACLLKFENKQFSSLLLSSSQD